MRGTLSLFRTTRFLRGALPVALAAALAFGPVAVVNAAKHAKKLVATTPLVPGIHTIALFATTNQASTGGDVAASAFDTALKMRLNMSSAYQVTSFTTRLPAVQRAITESAGGSNSLTSADIKTPVTDPNSARKISAVMATDGYMLDEVDGYKEDPNSHAVTVTVSGSLYSTGTGSAVRTFAVTGTAGPEIAGEDESAVTERAVASAASQIVSTLGVATQEKESTLPNSSHNRSSVGGSILLVALAGLLIGVIAANLNSRGHSVSNGTSTPTSTSGSSTSSTTTTTSTTGPPAPPTS